MPFSIEGEERGLFFLIRINGDFSVRSIAIIRKTMEDAMTIGHVSIALNLQKTVFIDSSGIGLIMNVYKKLQEKGGSVYLINVAKEIREAINITGMLQLIKEYKSEEEAETYIS